MPLQNYMIAHKEKKYFHPQKHIAHLIKISRGFLFWCNASINCTCQTIEMQLGYGRLKRVVCWDDCQSIIPHVDGLVQGRRNTSALAFRGSRMRIIWFIFTLSPQRYLSLTHFGPLTQISVDQQVQHWFRWWYGDNAAYSQLGPYTLNQIYSKRKSFWKCISASFRPIYLILVCKYSPVIEVWVL